MNLQETIRRVLRETKEEKIRSFLFTRFDRVFNELTLEVEYGDDNYLYAKWFDKENKDVFHRNTWGSFWIVECEPYKKLRSYSSSLLLDLNEFEELLKEYLNERYGDKFKGKIIRKIGDQYNCLKESYPEEMSEMKEGELTEKCWTGYTRKGMKTMFGKRYPNCVKKTKK